MQISTSLLSRLPAAFLRHRPVLARLGPFASRAGSGQSVNIALEAGQLAGLGLAGCVLPVWKELKVLIIL